MWAFYLLLAALAVSPVEPHGTVSELHMAVDSSATASASLASGDVVASNSRTGKPFTKKQKQIVKGVTPPKNETQVDHKVPKGKGGPGDVDNAQVLCRDCNLKKGSKEPGSGESP